ncbi:hypothetical protein Lfu02_41990 [Longispora fulva]|uniref:DUF2690 domain-containing protein n=1 Tax=Longispora fulva TaxID=619741 RepID=A0A8J7GHX2_9ACTN|nr:DUF2690 domain-containing protein [Longispora fulva]MBG6136658.1 hypothetical protein [Longispora fulva]GIG59827.1 hypothetical protein Lfu02_41990 [Longispora fulva]
MTVRNFGRWFSVSIVVATALTGLAAPASASGVVTPQANPAGDYCGPSCDGVDPTTPIWLEGQNAAACAADARTVYTANAGQGYIVELRYSKNCETVWARSSVPYYGRIERSDGATYQVGSANYSLMFDDHRKLAKACIGVPASGGTVCTPLY